MFITTLMEVGQIYLVLTNGRGDIRITVKNGKGKPFDNVLIDSTLKVNTIYKYLLANWASGELQIFLTET